MATLIESLRERLGVAKDTSEADVLAAFDEALAEQASPEAPEAKPDIAAALAAVKENGQVVMDAGVVAQLQAQAKAGADAMAHIEADARAREVQAHVDRGAILPKDKDRYASLLKADAETTRAILAGIPANTIPVAEIGHGHAEGSVDVTTNDLFKNWSI